MSLPASAIPPALADNAPADAAAESAATLTLLARRRSTKAPFLAEPAPNADQLDALLRLAARVPDHGKIGPWRFVILEGEGRDRAGAAIAAADTQADASQRDFARTMFTRAPLCVMVVSTAAPHKKVPEWEQVLSAGAVCHQMLLAAHAMGFAGCWLSEWPTYDAGARAALGLAAHERIAGFIYLGSTTAPALERVRPDVSARISRF